MLGHDFLTIIELAKLPPGLHMVRLVLRDIHSGDTHLHICTFQTRERLSEPCVSARSLSGISYYLLNPNERKANSGKKCIHLRGHPYPQKIGALKIASSFLEIMS